MVHIPLSISISVYMVPISYFLNIIICTVNKCALLYSLVHLYHIIIVIFVLFCIHLFRIFMILFCYCIAINMTICYAINVENEIEI